MTNKISRKRLEEGFRNHTMEGDDILDALATCVSQGSIAQTEQEMFCDKCNRVLMQVPCGAMKFTTVKGNCDCSWDCCEHSHSGPGKHTVHLQYRNVR